MSNSIASELWVLGTIRSHQENGQIITPNRLENLYLLDGGSLYFGPDCDLNSFLFYLWVSNYIGRDQEAGTIFLTDKGIKHLAELSKLYSPDP